MSWLKGDKIYSELDERPMRTVLDAEIKYRGIEGGHFDIIPEPLTDMWNAFFRDMREHLEGPAWMIGP